MPAKPPVVRLHARHREKIERMVHAYAANLANMVIQSMERQINEELAAAMRQAEPARAPRNGAAPPFAGMEVLRLP